MFAHNRFRGVTSMSDMFDKADLFNQDLSGWNVKNVLNMHRMFSDASFNQNLSEWDVSKVTAMDWMFDTAISFDRDLSGWDVGNVTNMYRMFKEAKKI
mmetsp:Transcript_38659/g.89824  ORF Transcript_38659/g.89824 Transcript_38659/m.89824 type:complete len:98 (+) Transcript_38659:347-640(+)